MNDEQTVKSPVVVGTNTTTTRRDDNDGELDIDKYLGIVRNYDDDDDDDEIIFYDEIPSSSMSTMTANTMEQQSSSLRHPTADAFMPPSKTNKDDVDSIDSNKTEANTTTTMTVNDNHPHPTLSEQHHHPNKNQSNGRQKDARSMKTYKNISWLWLTLVGVTVVVVVVTVMSWYFMDKKQNNDLRRSHDKNAIISLTASSPPISLSTSSPSVMPTFGPSFQPITPAPMTSMPTTLNPTTSKMPSISPTTSVHPTMIPSYEPTHVPSDVPTTVPTNMMSHHPTNLPSTLPSTKPSTDVPSMTPSDYPTTLLEATSAIFCVIGDVPYTPDEATLLQHQMLYEIPHDAKFLVHVGDIRTADHNPVCKQEEYTNVAQILQLSHTPVFVLLGDNEWNDCPNVDDGLTYWENEFLNFDERYWNDTYLGIIDRPYSYPMDFSFIYKNTLFIGLNLVGLPVKDIHEWYTRLSFQAWWTMNWIRQYNATTDGIVTKRVVIFGHAEPTQYHDDYFKPLAKFIKNELHDSIPILYIHGDGHKWAYEPNFMGQSSFLRIMVTAFAERPPLKIMINNNPNVTNVQDAFILG